MATPYNVGTITVANGGTTVTGSGTFWVGKVEQNDMLFVPAQGLMARVTGSPTDNEEMEVTAWAGTDLTDEAYEIIPAADNTSSSARVRDLLANLRVVEANGRGLFYLFSDTMTDSDPGAGYVRLNNADPSLATEIYIDNLDANGATTSGIIDTWDDSTSTTSLGQVWFRSISDPSTFHAYKIMASVVDGTGYRKLTVDYIGGSGTFPNAVELMVAFAEKGDQGDGYARDADVADTSGLAAYEGEDAGFLVFVTDLGTDFGAFTGRSGVVRLIAGPDWELAALYTGPVGATSTVPGPTGPAGIVWVDDAWASGTTYAINEGTQDNGSSWRSLQNGNLNHPPPTLPTVSNAWWSLVARAGTDGTGTGDVVGPAGATADRVAVFDGTTGKLLKDGGKTIAELAPAGYDDLLTTVSLLALQVADNTNVALFLGGSGNRVADSFDALTYVDVAGATNLDTGTAGVLKPTTSGGIDANTMLMLSGNGADASTTITDSSSSARTITAVGNAQIDTGQSKFGGASIQFDGSGDYITVPDSADWAFGSGNFTIEMWVRLNSFSSCRLAGQATDAQNGWRWYPDATTMRWQYLVSNSVVIELSGTHGMSTGTWHHLAVEKSGTTYRLYRDGVVIATATDADTIGNLAGTLQFGTDPISTPTYLDGWMDEIRVSNVARFNGAFTPPTSAYTVPTTNNETVRSAAFTAASVPTKMMALLRVKEIDAATAGTDYTMECSRDGGTTWSAMTLAEKFSTPDGIRIVESAELDVTGQPSGTSPRWRFKTLNNKNVELHDVYFYWN